MAPGQARLLDLAPEASTIVAVERALIGGALLEPFATLPPLLPTEFFLEGHRLIWETLLDLSASLEAPDATVLAHELDRRGRLDEVGGPSAIALLLADGGLSLSMSDYARQVRQAARARELQRLGVELSGRGLTEDEVQTALADLPGPLGSALFDPAENWRRIVDGWQRASKILTGLERLDAMTGGVALGDLMVVAGRTSHGKTAFISHLALELARQGVEVELFTLEETPDAMVRRLAANLSGVSARKLREGNLSAEDFEAAERAIRAIQALPLTLTGLDSLRSLGEETVLGAAAHSRARVVMLDHLQKIHTRGESRVYGLEGVMNRLHAQAIRDNRAVIVAVQIGRDMESERRPPRLSDIRDCIAGDQRVILADTGQYVAVKTLAHSRIPVSIWALNERWKLVRAQAVCWPRKKKFVWEVRTRTGRSVQCSSRHRLLTPTGWRKVSDLSVGDELGVPRRYGDPESLATMNENQALLLGWLLGDGSLYGTPTLTVSLLEEVQLVSSLAKDFGLTTTFKPDRRAYRVFLSTGARGRRPNALVRWLKGLNAWETRAADKHIPLAIFGQPKSIVSAVLRGLVHADGTLVRRTSGRRSVKFSSVSRELADGVHRLLIRLGIVAVLSTERHGRGRFRSKHARIHVVRIEGREMVERFTQEVGFICQKAAKAAEPWPTKGTLGRFLDRLPLVVNERIRERRRELDLTEEQTGWHEQGKRISRATAAALGDRLDDPELRRWGRSDLLWDRVMEIRRVGRRRVYDLAVDGPHNFCVGDIVAHNCGAVEILARSAWLLYWPWKHKPDRDWNEYELYVAKQTDGGTGLVPLRFEAPIGRFS